MTSRERIEVLYRHEPTDRVGTTFKNDEPPVTDGLKRLLAVTTREEVLERLGIDLRLEGPPYTGPQLVARDGKGTPTHWGTISESYTAEVPRPLAHVERLSNLGGWRPPDPAWFDYEEAGRNAMRWKDHAVMLTGWEPLYCRLCDLFGMEKALMMLASEPELVDRVVGMIADYALERMRRLVAAAGKAANIVYFGDDFASDRGLMMGYPLWKRFFREPMRRIIRTIRDARLHAHVHTCGAMRELLSDYVDMGVESIEPCQFHLPGMEPASIKRDYGKHLVFYGGVDSQRVLPFGSPDDVRREVRRRIEVVGEGGGYVCASDHSLLADVPPKNVLAMYEEAGSYKP
ncbi:MAG: uroporphyrinogen decarboxylase family protein [Planctomycetota bacterium]